MNIMMNTGKSGLLTYQYDLDVIGHNIANVGTVGYKSTKTSFRDLIFSSMDINKNREFIENNRDKDPLSMELTGRGVRALGQDMLYNQGAITTSEYQLDYAIEGDALFAVDYRGTTMYTRNGNFDISVEGNENYLVTADGGYVLDWNGDRIVVPFKVTDDGTVTDTIDIERLDPQLGMFTFDNPHGLMRRDGTRFLQTANSGEPQTAIIGEGPGTSNLLGRYLERSNVDIAKEMSDLIVTQRAYQFSARIVTTADDIEDLTNTLRQ
ncbi:flagellar basal-body rod protein FlgG [Clostridia bacterium]|nr:flagellar basal-body rod protein FlgG [Clostridia bacterium]